MIKVFLIEDEALIRNGIRNSIHWEQEGFSFVGEAEDGEMALPMIKKKRPDILITDIRMPFMDGLELSEAVHKLFPEMKIIILSGYGEFEYARRAISIGVTEYLLKPISAKKLLEVLRHVAEEIEEEREEIRLRDQYLKEMQENEQQKRNRFFDQLMSGKLVVSEILEESDRLGIQLHGSCYLVGMFKIRNQENEILYSEDGVLLTDQIQSFLNKNGILFYSRGLEGLVFLLMAEESAQAEKQQEEIFLQLTGITKAYPGNEYFGSCGNAVNRLGLIKESYYQAEKAFSTRFIQPWNQIVDQEKAAQIAPISVEQEAMDLGHVSSMRESRELIKQFLAHGVEEEASEFVEAYLDNLNRNNMKSLIFRQYVVMDTYFCVSDFLDNLARKPEGEEEKEDAMTLGKYVGSLEKTRDYIEELIKHAIGIRDTGSGHQYGEIIRKAKDYIKQEYQNETISLNSISRYVNVSPNYFSAVFSREVGKTFVEYLTEVRMEKARELLMCSSMKASEIGYEVGYRDAHYFGYIFKKTQGCTPREYRARRQESGEEREELDAHEQTL